MRDYGIIFEMEKEIYKLNKQIYRLESRIKNLPMVKLLIDNAYLIPSENIQISEFMIAKRHCSWSGNDLYVNDRIVAEFQHNRLVLRESRIDWLEPLADYIFDKITPRKGEQIWSSKETIQTMEKMLRDDR